MAKVMSIEEINARFDSEWVLIEDPETTELFEVKRGKVICHSKDRDEVYRKAIELKPRHSAFLFTGKPPKNMVIVL